MPSTTTPTRNKRRVSAATGAAAGGALTPTSLKLPAGLKAQIDDLAGKEGLSAHAFMLNTLSAATERAHLREQFQADALAASREMDQTGRGHALTDVRNYFAKLALFREGKGPKPRRPVSKKMS